MNRATRRSRAGVTFATFAFTAGLFCTGPALAQQSPPLNLAEVSLEELLTMRIVSAGKKEQTLAETAAAIHVITADDIRRSHATSIPELLRQVPGIHVAREGVGDWAISIRGFNDSHANKLLVLMDGRTLYTPLYTGVNWDIEDTMIEDIERVEIIRGPGASVWGANAVNGVVNIITKQASDTEGGLVTYHAGTRENGTVAARYGGSLGDTAHYRVFSKYFVRESFPTITGDRPWGGWDAFRQGGRVDWALTETDRITATGEWFTGELRELDDELVSFTPPFEAIVQERDKTDGGFLVTRWNRRRSDSSEYEVAFFYDKNRRYDRLGHDRDESVETTDLEFRHRTRAAERHDLVWGGGFRRIRDRVGPTFDHWFVPESRTAHTYNGFLQDEIRFFGDAVRVTAGSKVEWNTFSKTEVQPTARFLWAATPVHSVWTAASRAVRVPSRTEVDRYSLRSISMNDDGVLAYQVRVPNPQFKPEKLTAYEAGYRFIPTRRLSLDVTSFYNVYDDLQTLERRPEYTATTPLSGIVKPRVIANNAYGNVYGAEIVSFWTVSDALQVSGSYTRLNMQIRRNAASNDSNVETIGDRSAKNLFYLRTYADLPSSVELNTEVRFVGSIAAEEVPAYVDADVHLSRPIGQRLRLNVTGDNLLHRRRPEWDGGEALVQSRGVRASIGWQF